MFDEGRFGHVDGQLADVGHIITNPLEMFGNEQQPRIARGGGGFSDHHFDQVMKDVIVEIVNLGVSLITSRAITASLDVNASNAARNICNA